MIPEPGLFLQSSQLLFQLFIFLFQFGLFLFQILNIFHDIGNGAFRRTGYMATLADSSGIAYVSTHAVFISPQVRSYAYEKHGVTVEVIESAQCQSFSAIIGTYSGRQLEAGISFFHRE